MPYENPNKLRQDFLEFFEMKFAERAKELGETGDAKTVLPSSSLVPHDDPSTLFTSHNISMIVI